MNTISLDVLIKAVEAMKMLRKVARDHLTTEQYLQEVEAYSRLSAHVEHITQKINVEVPA